MDRER